MPPLGFSAIEPDPLTLVVSVNVPVVFCVKVAVTVLFASIVTLIGVVVPLTAPLQPVKLQPDAGVAVRLTTVPAA